MSLLHAALEAGSIQWGTRSPRAGNVTSVFFPFLQQEERELLPLQRLQIPQPLEKPQRLPPAAVQPQQLQLQRLQGEELQKGPELQVRLSQAAEIASQQELLSVAEPLAGAFGPLREIQEEEPLLQGSAVRAAPLLREAEPPLRQGPPRPQPAPEMSGTGGQLGGGEPLFFLGLLGDELVSRLQS